MKQFTIPIRYRSPLIAAIKQKRKAADKLKKDFTPTLLDMGPVRFFLARHFGFCYGVENAIEIAFQTVENNPGKQIFLLSEMIHNPFVNEDLINSGVQFLMDTKGNNLIPFESLTAEDIVIIPAFGTTIEIENRLKNIGIQIEQYNTTCPFVEKVWNRAEQISEKGYSIVVHGKPTHEETRATFSHSDVHTPTIVVNDMAEAIVLGEFILGKRSSIDFTPLFGNRCSKGFDVEKDLVRFGVVNQTTMLATDTQAIADYLKQIVIEKYNLDDASVGLHFADTRDTLCYATNDNQTSTLSLMENEVDLAIVVGGYNSSNTSHLVEILEQKFPTYFIANESGIISKDEIHSYNIHQKFVEQKNDFLPDKPHIRIALTSGASCPDAIVDEVIQRILALCNEDKPIEEVLLAI